MSTRIEVTIEVDSEYADPDDSTGLTEEGYEILMEAVNSVGILEDGPKKVD